MYKINRKEIEELLLNLIAIKSPYFEEDDIMNYVFDWFKENNMDSKIHNYHEKKVTGFKGKNIVVELDNNKNGPPICLNGPLYTVKLCNGWTKNHKGEIDGDKIYGLGSLDMKSGCVSTMIALKAFTQNHDDFNGKIISTYVSVEEGPYGMGTNALIEDGIIKDVDISIITEPSAGFNNKPFPDVCLGARGGYGLDIEFYGKSAHAATPELGISAAIDASKVIVELENIEFIEDSKLGKGSICVVAVDCDGGACSVPDYAKVKLFRHIVVGENEDTIINELENVIARANISGAYKINFRESPTEGSKGFMPYSIEDGNELTESFLQTIKSVCDVKPSISYFKSIGDFNYLGSRIGAPAIIFGAAGSNFHSADEYVFIDSVVKTAEVIYNYLENVLCEED